MQDMIAGDIAPRTGKYQVIDSTGRVCAVLNIRKGDRLPKTHNPEHRFRLSFDV